jgi:hypothetical protein
VLAATASLAIQIVAPALCGRSAMGCTSLLRTSFGNGPTRTGLSLTCYRRWHCGQPSAPHLESVARQSIMGLLTDAERVCTTVLLHARRSRGLAPGQRADPHDVPAGLLVDVTHRVTRFAQLLIPRTSYRQIQLGSQVFLS